MAESLIRGIPFQYEMKRINRFYAEFPSELGVETWLIQKFKRPSLKIASVEVPFMNETNYVSGKYKWDSVTLDFLDPIGPSASQILMEWVRLHAESLTGRMGYKMGSAKTLILRSLDPTGVDVEKWTLEQCIITSVDFGENSYEDDGLQKITVELQPYRCILNQ